MIIPAQTLRLVKPVEPFCERTVFNGMSYGLSHAGYDIRIAQTITLTPANRFSLASSLEKFTIPNDILARVCDKSSWARQGIAVQNTVIEPGWCGYLTLEIAFHPNTGSVTIVEGSPIAQILFERLESPTVVPYTGKYQNQQSGPVGAINEA